ncbi:MAG TPA: ATP-dependent zinc metalloprotease FtsH [Tepidisphaeraceae bacterium]|nr:ATP-dependent zinc metalloprotease FtsH [Tepidisphaeraceae bacterium]
MSAEQRPEKPARKNSRGPGANGGLRFGRGVFGWILFIGLAVMLFMLVSKQSRAYHPIDYSQFWTELDNGKIKELTIENDEIHGQFNTEVALPSGQKIELFRTTLPTGLSMDYEFLKDLVERGRKSNSNPAIKVENSQNFLLQFILPLIPWLLIFGFIWFFVFRQLRNSAGAGGMLGNFGRSRHKITSKEHTNVTFDDVAGIEEAKEEVIEIVEFLKNPRKFQRLGGRIPRGVLLVGEPGTGKTLLAKAIAGEADVPFFSISGSDFVEMFVGVGASRVRDLFKQAKDNSPCIIFLDEIDAVGRRRGSGFSSGGHDEREQTLNAILVEMDGFDTNDQVIVIAATNRVDVLDPALTRPGRFDRQIYVPLPDVKGRLEILKVHSRKVKLGPNVDLLRLARATPGFSGADLAAIINEAALAATLAGKEFIEQDDLEEARDKVRWGRARKSRVIDEKEKIATAYHEAGHAVVQYLEKDADPIHKVTIIPRGQMGGATFALPEKDRTNYSRRWCLATMKTLFGGRIAEQMFCGDINTGALGDIRQATSIARKMVRDWGMNERLGFIYYGEDDTRPNYFDFGGREYSEETARIIDEEVKKLIDRLYEETRQLLEANRDRVEAVAKALMRYETLDASDIDRIMRGDNLSKPTVSDLLAKEQTRRATTIQPATNPAEPDVQPGLGGGALPAPG